MVMLIGDFVHKSILCLPHKMTGNGNYTFVVMTGEWCRWHCFTHKKLALLLCDFSAWDEWMNVTLRSEHFRDGL